VSIKCVIIDDEPLAVQLIESYVDRIEKLDKHASFSNPLDALKYLRTHKVDLVFLDIQMPELSGVEVAQIIDSNIKVIFTTAYPDFAAKGFELKAVDYLIKPISFIRFVDAVDRVIENEVPIEDSSSELNYIFVKTEYRLQKINVKDIIYLKGMGDYCTIHLSTGKVMTLEKLKSFTERLPSRQFCRVHKSYIVAIDKIDFIEKNRIQIADQLIPIGSTYEEAFKKLLK